MNPSLSLAEMQAFLSVEETGGFGHAARQLGLAQSTVSRRIASLERRVGQRLIARTTRRQTLTEAGRHYADAIRDILAQFDLAHARLQSREQEPQGLLRITMPSAFGHVRVLPCIAALSARHPRLTFSLDFSDHYVDLLDGQIDVAIRLRTSAQSGIESERLTTIGVALCASPAYLARHPTPASPEDLASHVWLAYRTYAPRIDWSVQWQGRASSLTIDPALTANDSMGLQRLAELGAGLAVLPRYLCEESLAAGRLVEVLPALRFAPRDFYLAYPQHAKRLPKVQMLLEALRTLGDA